MMFILSLDSFEDLDQVIAAKPDAVVAGLESFSSRTRADLSLDELADFVRSMHEEGIAVYLNMQAMVEQIRLDQAEAAFNEAIAAGVDGIYAADDAYLEFAENSACGDVRDRIIIQPETLICSPEDANFFASQNTMAQSLSHELSLQELLECAAACSSLEMLVAGRYSWMESRRPLLLNYLSHIHSSSQFKEGKVYSLRELTREGKLPVWQDHLGTHVLSDELFQAGSNLVPLHEAGIDRFRIDCLLQGNVWGIEMLRLYRDLLNNESEENQKQFPIESTIAMDDNLIRKEKTNVR